MTALSRGGPAGLENAQVVLGEVVAVEGEQAVVVVLQPDGRTALCELIESSDGAKVRLVKGDRVLVWHDPSCENGVRVVLGRLGASRTPNAENKETPAELVMEARRNLTLKCGSGSITIREDGKILIKGKDLVSHAKRLNRIKGGAVQIN